MKREVKAALCIGLLLLALTVGLVVNAQGPDGGAKKGVTLPAPPEAALAGIGDPPPAGFSVLYMFTGVANEVGGDADEVTVVHCTNFHPSAAADVRVQVYSLVGGGPTRRP